MQAVSRYIKATYYFYVVLPQEALVSYQGFYPGVGVRGRKQSTTLCSQMASERVSKWVSIDETSDIIDNPID